MGLAIAVLLALAWRERGIHVPLVVVDSPYRDITGPVVDYVTGHWWEQLVHNQSALRIKSRLLFQPGVVVTSVPFRLPSAARAHHPDPVTT